MTTPALISFDVDEGTPLAMAPHSYLTGRAEWTGGAYCITGSVLAPGAVVPPHVHDREAQATIVISGSVGTWVDGHDEVVGAGGYSYRPAGLPHALFNPTAEPARFLEVTSPGARFQDYMLALSALIEAGDADPAAVRALAGGHGMTFLDEPLHELRERHGLVAA
jgi:mannose-6-phosphate isomerase-like protein (cupin superfamily)